MNEEQYIINEKSLDNEVQNLRDIIMIIKQRIFDETTSEPVGLKVPIIPRSRNKLDNLREDIRELVKELEDINSGLRAI